jgi:lipoprotein-releasing system ATP-binding protein
MGLVVENLDKEFPTRSGPLVVLSGINLSLADGEALAVMGPSGSGKSTLLNILGTLDSPTRGTVTVDGTNPFALSEPELAAFRNRHVGFIFQDHHLLPQCSVLENVLIPTLVADGDRSVFETEARRLLDRVGLGGRLDHRPAELSGGERQRAAIARALIRKPKLLLADGQSGPKDCARRRRAADRTAPPGRSHPGGRYPQPGAGRPVPAPGRNERRPVGVPNLESNERPSESCDADCRPTSGPPVRPP